MRTLRLGTLLPDGRLEPASELAAAILVALATGDENQQRALLMLAAAMGDAEGTPDGLSSNGR